MCRVCVLVAGLCLCIAKPSFAIRAMGDVFVATYAGEDASPEFQKLVKVEARCNVCHIFRENRAKRNPYGVAFHDALKESKFPMAEFKKAPKDEKLVAMMKEVMKKLEDQKPKDSAPDAKTFGARMKVGMLPGGDKLGK